MKIKVVDLKEFIKRSAKITSNGIIPIYDYLLFEFNKESICITKTNGQTYCKHEIDNDGNEVCSLLIEEKRLTSFVNNTGGEELTFKIKNKQVEISDSVNLVSVPTEEVSLFPAFPEQGNSNEAVSISSEVIKSLNEAKQFRFNGKYETNYSYIYVSKNEIGSFVFATSGNVFYLKKFEEDLPAFSLSPESCSMLLPYSNVLYYSSNNYNFFNTGKTIFGFIQSELKSVDFRPVLNSVNRSEWLEIDRKDFVDFSDLVLSFSFLVPIIRFSFSGENVLANYSEENYNVNAERLISAKKNFEADSFNFNASFINMALRCFTGEKIKAFPAFKSYCFESEEEKGLSIVVAIVHY